MAELLLLALYTLTLVTVGMAALRWRRNIAHGIARRRYAMFHRWPVLRDFRFLYSPAFWSWFVAAAAIPILLFGGVACWWAVATLREGPSLHSAPLPSDPVGYAIASLLGCALVAFGVYVILDQPYVAEVLRLSWQTDVPVTTPPATRAGARAHPPDRRWVIIAHRIGIAVCALGLVVLLQVAILYLSAPPLAMRR